MTDPDDIGDWTDDAIAEEFPEGDGTAETEATVYCPHCGEANEVALDPGIWCDYADAAALAQGGRLEGKPAQLIARSLGLDPSHPRALEMAGSLAIEQGDHASAARHWRLLLGRLAADDPRRPDLARATSRAERLATPGMTNS